MGTDISDPPPFFFLGVLFPLPNKRKLGWCLGINSLLVEKPDLGVNLDEMFELTKCCLVCDADSGLRNVLDYLALGVILAFLRLRPAADKERVTMRDITR